MAPKKKQRTTKPTKGTFAKKQTTKKKVQQIRRVENKIVEPLQYMKGPMTFQNLPFPGASTFSPIAYQDLQISQIRAQANKQIEQTQRELTEINKKETDRFLENVKPAVEDIRKLDLSLKTEAEKRPVGSYRPETAGSLGSMGAFDRPAKITRAFQKVQEEIRQIKTEPEQPYRTFEEFSQQTETPKIQRLEFSPPRIPPVLGKATFGERLSTPSEEPKQNVPKAPSVGRPKIPSEIVEERRRYADELKQSGYAPSTANKMAISKYPMPKK
jgi:hypothetical protein